MGNLFSWETGWWADDWYEGDWGVVLSGIIELWVLWVELDG